MVTLRRPGLFSSFSFYNVYTIMILSFESAVDLVVKFLKSSATSYCRYAHHGNDGILWEDARERKINSEYGEEIRRIR